MKSTLSIAIGLLVVALCSAAQPPHRIDAVMPPASQLGRSWRSNHVIVLLDSLSSPKEISSEGDGWLQAARNVIGKRGCNSYCVVRYFCQGEGSFLVWSRRYETKEQIGDDWGKDYDGLGRAVPPKAPPDDLGRIGDEVRFHQRHGMHNNLAFRRGNFVFDVEGRSIPRLKELAAAIDTALLKIEDANKKADARIKETK